MKRKLIIAIVLVALSLMLRLFSDNRSFVEDVYSNKIYPAVSGFFRMMLGWLPFSFGDILYLLAGLWILFNSVKFFTFLATPSRKRIFSLRTLLNVIILCSSVYLVFNLLWGLNYNRHTVAKIYDLDTASYSRAELVELNSLLLKRVNEAKASYGSDSMRRLKKSELFRKGYEAYRDAEKTWPQLHVEVRSAKPSIFSYLGNYLGFYGYYNPFTAEAQVNTTIPTVLLPFTTTHEIAHQLGYAKENEANFVGYLAASNSREPYFRYSVYFDLFIYANRELFYYDSALAKLYADSLSSGVKEDIRVLKKFHQKYQGPTSRLITYFYSFYLRSNSQPQGMQSYDDVVGMLIAFRRKYGKV